MNPFMTVMSMLYVSILLAIILVNVSRDIREMEQHVMVSFSRIFELNLLYLTIRRDIRYYI